MAIPCFCQQITLEKRFIKVDSMSNFQKEIPSKIWQVQLMTELWEFGDLLHLTFLTSNLWEPRNLYSVQRYSLLLGPLCIILFAWDIGSNLSSRQMIRVKIYLDSVECMNAPAKKVITPSSQSRQSQKTCWDTLESRCKSFFDSFICAKEWTKFLLHAGIGQSLQTNYSRMASTADGFNRQNGRQTFDHSTQVNILSGIQKKCQT